MNRNSSQYFEDPVAAYSRLAPHYADLSSRRRRYLLGIENALVSRISVGSSSLLDVGAGDGSRALRIARTCGIPNIVLLEPSLEMAAPAAGIAQVLCQCDRHRRQHRTGPPPKAICRDAFASVNPNVATPMVFAMPTSVSESSRHSMLRCRSARILLPV